MARSPVGSGIAPNKRTFLTYEQFMANAKPGVKLTGRDILIGKGNKTEAKKQSKLTGLDIFSRNGKIYKTGPDKAIRMPTSTFPRTSSPNATEKQMVDAIRSGKIKLRPERLEKGSKLNKAYVKAKQLGF